MTNWLSSHPYLEFEENLASNIECLRIIHKAEEDSVNCKFFLEFPKEQTHSQIIKDTQNLICI